ncbi:hypothetical protein FRC07_007534 [Ceratobasidium sp. 392]|nr:hypothetical protein FRC07_007534 [Ceratobasidium sp. 392]
MPHPLAEVPVITSTDKFTSTFAQPSFQIVGRYIALLSSMNTLLSSDSPRIFVWDWTTGDLVTHADVVGKYFAFLSETCFIVGCDRRKWSKEVIGSLEVYKLDPSKPGRRANHIASFHLPTTPEGSCHSASAFTSTPFGPLSFSGFTPTTVPSRIYDLSPSSHYISLKLRAYNIQNHAAEMATGTLLISITSILDAISNVSAQVHIPWVDWGHQTYWINNRSMYSGHDHVIGQRAAFTRYNQDLDAWQMVVYDLGPSIRKRIESDPAPFAPALPLAEADSYLDRVFSGARSPVPVSLITIPKDVALGGANFLDNRPVIMMDDEHVVVFVHKTAFITANKLHVYTL